MPSRRLAKPVGFLLAAVAIVLSSSSALSEPAEQFDEIKLFGITYRVSDLPVWRSGGEMTPEFDPTVLIFYIKKSVDPGHWKNGAAVQAYNKNSLLIFQSEENHKQIAAILERFRESE